MAQAYRGSAYADSAGFDLIYTRTLPTLIAALTTTELPVVYETYRPWPRQKPRSRRFFEWVGRHPNFLGGVFHSEFARSSYLDVGMAPQKLLTAHNGYNPQVLMPRLERDAARRQLGLDLDACLFTYAGRISPKKGLQLVLDAADQFPQYHFMLIGSEGHGPVERRAESLANVSVLPWQSFEQTVPYLYASDVLLIPPTSGPLTKVGNTVLPIKTFNYLAVGRAILGPATPDLTELIDSEQHALLVEPDDQQVFFQAIHRLANDAELRARLGSAARALGAALTWEHRAAKICAFIETRLASR
jgi:glycosyltransferase involved in cell wall biosynthesis